MRGYYPGEREFRAPRPRQLVRPLTAPYRAAAEATKLEWLLGILLGIVLAIAVVVAFLVFSSEDTIDAPSLHNVPHAHRQR